MGSGPCLLGVVGCSLLPAPDARSRRVSCILVVVIRISSLGTQRGQLVPQSLILDSYSLHLTLLVVMLGGELFHQAHQVGNLGIALRG